MSATETINQPRKFQIKPRKPLEPVKAVRAPPKPRVPLLPLESAFLKEQSAENAKALLDGYASHGMTKVVAHLYSGETIALPLNSEGKWELRVVRRGTKVRAVLTLVGSRWLLEEMKGKAGYTYCFD